MIIRIAQAELDSIIVAWCFYDTRCVNFKPKQISAAQGGMSSGVATVSGVDDRGYPDWAWMRVTSALNKTESKQSERHLLETAIKNRWRDGGSPNGPSLRTRCMVENFLDHLLVEVHENPLLKI